MLRHAQGILFDTAYIEPDIHLWILDPDGGLFTVTVPFAPVFYLAGPLPAVRRAAAALGKAPGIELAGWTQRTDFWTGKRRRVFAVKSWQPHGVSALARRMLHQDHRLQAFDVDVDPCLSFHSRHNLFPLAKVSVSWEDTLEGPRLRFIRALDDPWDPGYRLPEFRTLTLQLGRSPLVALGQGNLILADAAGERHELRPEDGAAALHNFNALVKAHDPDVIVSQRGDQFIFPWLLEASARWGVPLELDRLAPPVQRRVQRDGKTLMVYSGIMFKAPDYPLHGRWHLDLTNSFFADKAGIEGVIEMARISRVPVQRQARRSGGAAITAMEIHLALERGILVPFVKDQVEGFRTAAELLQADKGGLSYFPPVGIFEGVLELDFQQMYPSIMAVHNVSPETMNCACCKGKYPVPGTSHHVCTRRRGLVPDALQGLLQKRLKYKQLIKESGGRERTRYETRATAIKWTLVTTFGYQGFHNAKFGLIAAHEAITAFGRESLLQAKEVFEEAGFRLLHALTDSLYLLKPGFTEEEVQRLCRTVEARTGLTLGVEGTYDWIAFLQSKMRENLSVATRYFGRFSHGELKVRGIKVRQHSTPRFLRSAQESFLRIMSRCRSRAELEAAAGYLDAAYRQYKAVLWSGRVPTEDLALKARVSREVTAYRNNSPVAVCLRLLAERGLTIPAGQTVRYVIVDYNHKVAAQRYMPEPYLNEVRDYDAKAYERLLQEVYNEVVAMDGTEMGRMPEQGTLSWGFPS